MEKWKKLWVWIWIFSWRLWGTNATTSLPQDRTHRSVQSDLQENSEVTTSETDEEYGYYYYYYGYYDTENENDDREDGYDNENDDNGSGIIYLQSSRPTKLPTHAPTKLTRSPTLAPSSPSLHPTRRPTGPTRIPSSSPSPTLSPTKFSSRQPTPGKPTLRPTTNAPSLHPTHGSLYEVKQFSFVADRVMISMMSVSLLLWFGFVAFYLSRHFNVDYSSLLSSMIQWTKDQISQLRGGGRDTAEGDKKRKKRTLRKAQHQQHEDYWTEESEDQRKNFPLRSSLDASLGSVNSNTSMLYSVDLDDHNWDESIRGGKEGGDNDDEEFYSVHSQSGIGLVNRNL